MNRDKKLIIRLTEKEFHKIKWLAETYAGGVTSKWVRYAAIEAPRKFLKPKKRPGPNGKLK